MIYLGLYSAAHQVTGMSDTWLNKKVSTYELYWIASRANLSTLIAVLGTMAAMRTCTYGQVVKTHSVCHISTLGTHMLPCDARVYLRPPKHCEAKSF